MPEPVDIRQMVNLPPEEAIRFLEGKGYRTTVNWAEMMHEDHERAFTVAKVARRDILEMIRRSIDKALREGTPFEAWKADLQPLLAREGWWGRVADRELTGTDRAVFVGPRRLRTIYDTNLRTARAAGLWQRIQEGKALRPYLRYSAVMDRRTRPLHRAWHDVVLPVDHPWWQTHFPPNGWHCRCTVVQLSERDLVRRNLKVTQSPPEGPPVPFWRPGAQEPIFVPRGIDPGFAYAPGSDYFRAITPPPVDAPLSLPMRGGAGFPLPEPRRLPADFLPPPPTGTKEEREAAYLERWNRAVANNSDGLRTFVIRDPVNEPTVVTDSFWRTRSGDLKIEKRDHGDFVELVALTLAEPDEIWEEWDSHDPAAPQREGAPPHQPRLLRKLMARFQIGDRAEPVIVFLEVGKDGWYGVTCYSPRSRTYLDRRRFGTLVWRRGP
jgi:SPP1 gp7 family putative phage head morphogenesis protein